MKLSVYEAARPQVGVDPTPPMLGLGDLVVLIPIKPLNPNESIRFRTSRK